MRPDLSSQGLPTALIRWFAELTDRGMVATDRDLRVIVWNRWMEIHSGRNEADVLGRPLFELYPDLVTRGVDQYYRDALAGRISLISHGLHKYLLSLPSTNADLGFSEMPQTGRVGPLSEGDDVIGTVTTLDDISDRLASESELRKQIEIQQMARVTAEKALRAKDEFLSTVSHEIRNPLNAVLGWTRILIDRKDVDPAMLTRALNVIDRNATAQARMIDDLLDVARIASGKLRLDLQSVDLVAVTLAAIDMIGPSAKAKEVAIRTSLDPHTPGLLGDPQRLQQVAWNLLSNAVKFTDAGGVIEVRVEPAGKMISLVVRDTGQGIRPEFLPFVFERFRQSDGSSTKRFGGLGLGLALVRELVELHGGTVTADSEGRSKGATFRVTFPTAAPDVRIPSATINRVQVSDPPSLSGIRVMVVEDQTDSRELLVEMLSRWGANVLAVGSCQEAVASLTMADDLPDVIVSDLGMEKEDGYDLIRQVRALAPDQGGRIPAIAVTGFANPDDRKRALAAGYHRHVSKPVDPVAVATAINDAVRQAAFRKTT